MNNDECFTICDFCCCGIDIKYIYSLYVLLSRITIEFAMNYPGDVSDHLAYNNIPEFVRLQLLKSLSKD